jgi:hypothetical protein
MSAPACLRLVPYARERLVLALVGAAALASLYPLNTQDVTRLSLATSLARRQSVDIDPWHGQTLDRAFRAGHWYADKPPGLSVFAIVPNEALSAANRIRSGPAIPVWRRERELWLVRVSTGGAALLLAAFLVGRAAEGLVPGFGAPAAVTYALGTIAGPLGATTTAHTAAGALGLAALVLASRRGRAIAAAGGLAATAVLFEYQAALIAVVVAGFVLARRGARGLAAYAAGALAPLAALGLYNRAAFGSPFHFSYAYVANRFAAEQHAGLFGIGLPGARGLWLTLVGDRGLLLVSPVTVPGVVGLVLLHRAGRRAEAVACLAIVAAYVLLDAGYFDPYGGTSPGPRFLVPALPFLALGFAASFRRWPAATAALAVVSIGLVTWDAFTWTGMSFFHLDGPPQTIWSHLGAPYRLGLAAVAAAAAAAAAVAAAQLPRAAAGRGGEG